MKYVALLAFCAGFILAAMAQAQENNPSGADKYALPPVSLVPIAPGGGKPIEGKSKIGEEYEKSPEHIEAGKQLFSAMNCNGCHSSGGGGMGANLMDKTWIYGGSIENIAASIVEGRPNGMPTWRGLIPMQQVWELAAYVKTLSENPTEK
jgi:cytochrome c oxidase cbb3-type subunit III